MSAGTQHRGQGGQDADKSAGHEGDEHHERDRTL